MCTSPLVRYRFKRSVPNFFLEKVPVLKFESYEPKRKGFNLIGKKKLESYFKNHSEYLSFMNIYCDYMEIPCGKCEECRKVYARDWSVRCYHESLTSDRACFITLTVDSLANRRFIDEIERSFRKNSKFRSNFYCKDCSHGNRHFRYPLDYSLCRGFIYHWLKKFRDYLYRNYGISIRYFGAGEYGSNTDRPHYHILIFGYDFPNIRTPKGQVFRTFPVQKSKKGVQMFVSEELRQLWTYGFSFVEELNINACSYVAKYCMKKIKSYTDEPLFDYYYGREPEFLFMSKGNCQANRCPYIDEIIKNRSVSNLRDISNPYCKNCNKTRGGLGFNWFWKNFYDIKRLGYIVIDGKKYPIPKYYKKLINLTDPIYHDTIHSDNIYYVNSILEDDPDRFSTERNETRRKINSKKNSFYNCRDIV